MYELRAVAENISRERCQHAEVHPTIATHPPTDVYECEVHVTNVSTPRTSGVVQPSMEPESKENAQDAPSTDADAHMGSAWHIPMTQEKSLQDLPSQLDLDWQDSVLPMPMPSVAAARNLVEELEVVGSSHVIKPRVVVDTFAKVSHIAHEAVMGPTE